MPNKIRKIKINNITADTLFNNCWNMFYTYGIPDPKHISFPTCQNNTYDQPVNTGYLSAIKSYTALDKIYDLDLKKNDIEKAVKFWVMHDLIHEVIDAPLDVAGDTFVVALSYHLELSKRLRKDLWSDYRFVIVNSRLISPIIKNNYLEYEKQISSINKVELLVELASATDQIMDGKTLNSEYIENIRSAYDLCARRRVQNLCVVFRGCDRLSA